VRKIKNETANPQNNTFASSDTQAEASACKRVVFFNAPEKNRHCDMDWLTWRILLTKQGKPKTLE